MRRQYFSKIRLGIFNFCADPMGKYILLYVPMLIQLVIFDLADLQMLSVQHLLAHETLIFSQEYSVNHNSGSDLTLCEYTALRLLHY